MSPTGCRAPKPRRPNKSDRRLLEDLEQVAVIVGPASDRLVARRVPHEHGDGIAIALEYAEALTCPSLHVMAGIPGPDVARGRAWGTYVTNLAHAAEAAAQAGRQVVIEPINTRDMPGFFLNYQADARRAIAEVGSAHLGLQLDLYHCQIMEGDLAPTIEKHLSQIGHVQLADNPGRHEPGTGEINYPFLFGHLDRLGYQGWIGCEYKPAATTLEGLGWLDNAR